MNTFTRSFSKAIFLAMVIPICAQGQEPSSSSLACKDALAPAFNVEGVVWKPAEAVSWNDIKDGAAKFAERDGRKGYRFAYDFSRVLYHFRWDGPPLELDLSKAKSFSFWVHGENADAILRGIFYLKSGKGWYGRYFDTGNGWNCVKVNLGEMWKEGAPAGWDHVDGIRISLEKAGDGQAAATIGEVTFDAKEVEVVAFQPPKEDA
ncbi:MAG: hypothetical protein Q8O19_02785, partial [Rectinemataceae bacterium]|nr:hypothetical protein [Rectinemataceae bacterium]